MPLPRFVRPLRRLLRPVAERWPWPVAARLPDGRVMYVDLRSAIGRGILATGEFDPGVFAPFRVTLRPGDTFLDVGANVGYYSMLASATVGTGGAVHAFEIDPRPLRCLRRTMRRVTNVRVHAVALGETEAQVRLETSAEAGHTRIRPGEPGGVVVRRLDDVCRDGRIGRVDAIKIDVEGAELHVLRGAESTLRTHRPVVVAEVVPEQLGAFGHTPSAVQAFLEGLDYEVTPLSNVHAPCLLARTRR